MRQKQKGAAIDDLFVLAELSLSWSATLCLSNCLLRITFGHFGLRAYLGSSKADHPYATIGRSGRNGSFIMKDPIKHSNIQVVSIRLSSVLVQHEFLSAFPKMANISRSTPPAKNELCDVCNTIDFDRYLFHKMSRDVPLGEWRRIVQNPFCPFCRLVVVALRENSSQLLTHPNDEIVLNNLESWELGIEMSPHDRLKSDAYSNMLDLRSRAKDCRDVAHRFVVKVEDQPIKAYLQYLVPRQLPKEERQFFGRTIDRETVDVRLLKSWLGRCKT